MSSIPVRKGVASTRRSGGLRETQENVTNINVHAGKDVREQKRHAAKENKSVPKSMVRQSSKKELLDENAKLHVQILEHEKKLKDLETSLNVTTEQLKNTSEETVRVKETCEKTLLSCNIDPVTLQHTAPSMEEENELKQRRDKTKIHLAALQEKLHTLNAESTDLISSLKDITANLDCLDCTESAESLETNILETVSV